MDLNPDTVGQASCRKNEARPRCGEAGWSLDNPMVQVIVFCRFSKLVEISPIFTGCKQTTYTTYIIGVIVDLLSTMGHAQ